MNTWTTRRPADPGLVDRVVAGLRAREPELCDVVADAVLAGVDPLDEVTRDELDAPLRLAIDGNVATVLERIGAGMPPEHDVPPAESVAYAKVLAQFKIPSSWLRRAYHLACDAALTEFFDEVEQLDCPDDAKLRVFGHFASWMHRFIDSTTRMVLELHDAELGAGAQRHLDAVLEQVQRVLDDEPVDAAAFRMLTGHDVDGSHLCAVLWLEGAGRGPERLDLLRTTAVRVAEVLEAPAPLVVPVSGTKLWVWFDVEETSAHHLRPRIREAVEAGPVRATLGSPGVGRAGFRRTLEQARALFRLTQAAPTVQHQVLSNDDEAMAVVAMLAADLLTTRRWVLESLGSLAEDSEGAERMRDTIRVYLHTSSYTETSEQLQLHRNTVKYRVTKVVKERGRPLADGALDLELALQVCHVLGRAVLAPHP